MSLFRFASLGSGSRGNATLVEAGSTRVLVDNGFSLRECSRRLDRLGVAPASIRAILVTHEHSDHAAGVAGFAARHSIPVFLSAGTSRAMEGRGHFEGVRVDRHRLLRGMAFGLDDVTVLPVRVPHDAQEPCQYVFEFAGQRLGILTDLGGLTPQVIEAFGGCDALLLECNHDRDLLRQGSYPASLKARVGGDFGHLSNCQAAEFLCRADVSRLQTLVIGHLSDQNNRESLARQAVSGALGWHEERIVVASQAAGHDWVTVTGTDARIAGHCGA